MLPFSIWSASGKKEKTKIATTRLANDSYLSVNLFPRSEDTVCEWELLAPCVPRPAQCDRQSSPRATTSPNSFTARGVVLRPDPLWQPLGHFKGQLGGISSGWCCLGQTLCSLALAKPLMQCNSKISITDEFKGALRDI